MFVVNGKQVLNNNAVLANCKSEEEAQKLADSKNNPTIDIEALRAKKLLALKNYVNAQEAIQKEPYSNVSAGNFNRKKDEYFASLNGGITPYVDMLCTPVNGELDVAKRDDLLVSIGKKVHMEAQGESYEDDTRAYIKDEARTVEELQAIVI